MSISSSNDPVPLSNHSLQVLEHEKKLFQELASKSELDDVLDLFCREIGFLMQFDGYLVNLADEKQENLICEKLKLPAEFKGIESTYLKYKYPFDRGDANLECHLQGEVLWINEQNLSELPGVTQKHFKIWKVHTLVILPLRTDVLAVGTLMLFSSAGSLHPASISQIQTLIPHFVVPIQNAQQFSRLKEKEATLNTAILREHQYAAVVNRIYNLTSVELIYPTITKEFLKMFGFDLATIFMKESDKLVFKQGRVIRDDLKSLCQKWNDYFQNNPYRLQPNDGATSSVFKQNKPFYFQDVSEVLNLPMSRKDKTGLTMLKNPQSLLIMPIREADIPIGILWLWSLEKPVLLSDNEVKIIESLCSFIPTAIANAQRFAKVNEQRDEIASVQQALENLNQNLEQKVQEQTQVIQQQVDQLQHADKLKDEFLAATTHELKTPLNGIIGLADSLIDGVGGPLNELTQANLSMIVSSGKRLANMVNSLLDFSKLKHHTLKLQLKPVNLWEMAQIILELCNPLTEGKALQLINQIDPDFPYLEADPNRLQQILYNLIGNGIKFTDSGKVILTATRQEGMAAITVADTGIGIAPEDQHQIFESFVQGDGTLVREYEGTGLGLSITKKLVELHDGTIEVQSQPQKGAKFTFTLPFSKELTQQNADHPRPPQSVFPASPVSAKVELVSDTSNRIFKILVVDDDPVNRQVVKNYLNLHHYSIIEAANGKEALAFLETQGKPHLILLDVMMPQISGFEVCKIIRETYSPNELPIIFLTAKHPESGLIDGVFSGGNDYLTKPFSRRELLARIQSHIQLSAASERLTTFHAFNRQLTQESRMDAIGQLLFDTLCQQIFHTGGFLWLQLQNQSNDKQIFTRNAPDFLKKLSDSFWGDLWFDEQTSSDVILFNDISPDQFPTWFDPQTTSPIQEGHLLVVQLPHHAIIGLYRHPECEAFNTMDSEFSKTLVQSIQGLDLEQKAGKQQLQASLKQTVEQSMPNMLTADNPIQIQPTADAKQQWQQFQAFSKIELMLSHILYIQAESPYCKLVLESKRNHTLELRSPIHALERYFADDHLLQIHRSYLVNPKKVVCANQKVDRNYELWLLDRSTIPVGRSYLRKLRQRYAGWFRR